MGILATDRNSQSVSQLLNFTQGLDVDQRIAFSEIKVHRAWTLAWKEAGKLTESEQADVLAKLSQAQDLISKNQFPWRVEDEDVHMNLERFLGDIGKKLHEGRSRNDLVATTLRLSVSAEIETLRAALGLWQKALIEQASQTKTVLIPGMTHVQNAQPMRLAQWYLAYAQFFKRDLERLDLAKKQCLAVMPLGSGALTGSPVSLNWDGIAEELGFSATSTNSYEQVSHRDFIVEALQALSMAATHISRFCEDVIYYSSSNVGILALPKNYSTGSSMMPNKRNPDVMELGRAKSARLIAAESEALLIMKGLPTSYASDLHELKRTWYRAYDEALPLFEILKPFTEGLQANDSRAREHLSRGQILATELADQLCDRGWKFRDAYQQVARWVEAAEAQGVQVETLPEVKAAGISGASYESAIERRKSPGSSALSEIEKQIQNLM